jgi:hypothetical protein
VGFSAIDDKGFLIDIKPSSAVIKSGESVDVKVTLRPKHDIVENTKSTLTFMLMSGEEPVGYSIIECVVKTK